MSTASDRIRAQAERAAAKPSTKSEEGKAATAARAAAESAAAAPVRVTFRLERDQIARVRDWRAAVADDLVRTRVTMQETIAALLDELLDDQDLAARIVRRIEG